MSKVAEAWQRLLAGHAERVHLGGASALLSWDQETGMPPKAAATRGQQLATMAGLIHERLTDPEVGENLAVCADGAEELSAEDQVARRRLQKDFDRATRLPAALVRAIAEAESEGLEAWRNAREASDFTAFQPALAKLLDLNQQKAEALGYEASAYDALLDLFEEGATEAALAPLFEGLERDLQPLLAQVREHADRVSPKWLQGDFDEAAQEAFGREVAEAMGFDFEAGRMDPSTHPFCIGLGHGDTRMTRRFARDDLRPGLYGIMHEAGHGLYEQGLPQRWATHPLGAAVSLGVHESQSRLWENLVGRGRAFWTAFLPRLRHHFPGRFGDATPEDLCRAANHVAPSFIRVEADEVTYNLHVALRFQVERELFGGHLALADIPDRWNEGMQTLLGITPADDAEGCLQDIHWSMGAFGYFPTYTLGNLYAAQLYEAAQAEMPGLEDLIAAGRLTDLREWLRRKVHERGFLKDPEDLIEEATGSPPSTGPLLRSLQRRVGEAYGFAT